MLTDNNTESLNNSGSCTFGMDLNQETAVDISPVKDSDVNLEIFCIANLNICDTSLITKTESSADVEYGVNTDGEIPVIVCPIPIDALVESSIENNIILDQSVSQDKILKVDSNTETSPDDQRCISQDENTENEIVSVPKRPLSPGMKTHSSSSIKIINYNALRCKTSLVFVMCCVIGCCLIPSIVYYVSHARDSATVTNPEYSHKKNTSHIKVCYELSTYVHT